MEQLIKELEQLLAGNIKYRRRGICAHIPDKYKEELYKHFKTWQYFSGDVVYPVPDPENMLSPVHIYDKALVSRDMWVGKYGELRLDLVKHILFKLKNPTLKQRILGWFK